MPQANKPRRRLGNETEKDNHNCFKEDLAVRRVKAERAKNNEDASDQELALRLEAQYQEYLRREGNARLQKTQNSPIKNGSSTRTDSR